MATMSPKTAETVRALNDLLRGELSAVETYNQALSVVKDDPDARQDLEECQASHQDRVLRLARRDPRSRGRAGHRLRRLGNFRESRRERGIRGGSADSGRCSRGRRRSRPQGISGAASQVGHASTEHRLRRPISPAGPHPQHHFHTQVCHGDPAPIGQVAFFLTLSAPLSAGI